MSAAIGTTPWCTAGVKRQALDWVRYPRPPELLPEVMREFELHGEDGVHAVLIISTDGHGTSRETLLRLGNAVARRGEMLDFLKWKAAQTAWREKMVAVAAILAAVFSLISVLKG